MKTKETNTYKITSFHCVFILTALKTQGREN